MFAFQLKELQMLQSIKLWPLTSILVVKTTRIHKITRGKIGILPPPYYERVQIHNISFESNHIDLSMNINFPDSFLTYRNHAWGSWCSWRFCRDTGLWTQPSVPCCDFPLLCYLQHLVIFTKSDKKYTVNTNFTKCCVYHIQFKLYKKINFYDCQNLWVFLQNLFWIH